MFLHGFARKKKMKSQLLVFLDFIKNINFLLGKSKYEFLINSVCVYACLHSSSKVKNIRGLCKCFTNFTSIKFFFLL